MPTPPPNARRDPTALANAVAGVAFALFFLLHPGGGDPPSAAAASAPLYSGEHLLGLLALALMQVGLLSLRRELAAAGRLGSTGAIVAFIGSFVLGGVLYFDAFISPILATHAPDLLDATSPLNTPPTLLALALPGVVWGLGYVLLALAALRRSALPRPASVAVLLGAVGINLPPQPVGPVPLWVLALAATVFGLGLAWWGVTSYRS